MLLYIQKSEVSFVCVVHCRPWPSTSACGLKVVVSSGSIMPSVSEISISCLGSVDSLRWRSLAKFSRGVGPSCLSSHAAGHSGRDSEGSTGLEVSIMADGSFWRGDKQEDIGGTSVASWDATGLNPWKFHIHTGRNLGLQLLGPCRILLFFLGIMGSAKMALLANLLNRLWLLGEDHFIKGMQNFDWDFWKFSNSTASSPVNVPVDLFTIWKDYCTNAWSLC